MLHPFAIIIMNVGIGVAGEAMGGLTWSDGSGWVLGYYGVTECECIFHLSFVGRNDMKLIYAGGVWSWRGFKFEKNMEIRLKLVHAECPCRMLNGLFSFLSIFVFEK